MSYKRKKSDYEPRGQPTQQFGGQLGGIPLTQAGQTGMQTDQLQNLVSLAMFTALSSNCACESCRYLKQCVDIIKQNLKQQSGIQA